MIPYWGQIVPGESMSSVEITIELPEELVARARAAGLEIESQTKEFIALLEKEVLRREAGKRLLSTAEQLQSLPSEMKPSPEEIDEAVRTARSELAAERKTNRTK
jgi:hypothetical protein